MSKISTLAGIFSCVIWSSAVLVSSKIAISLGPLTSAGAELLLAGGFLLGASWTRRELHSMFFHSKSYFLVCGSFWAMNLTSFWLAVGSSNDSSQLVVVGLLNYLWPVLTLLLSIPILKKRPHWILIPGIIMALGGVLLGKLAVLPLSSTMLFDALIKNSNIKAYLFALTAACAWGLYSNLSRRLADPTAGSAVPLFMLTASIPLLVIGQLSGEHSNMTGSVALLLICWSIASGGAYLLWDIGMRKGDVITISACSMLIPFLSTCITAGMTGVGVTPLLLTAAMLVVCGSYISGKGVSAEQKN